MNYKVNILTKCDNEEESAVVIASALTMLGDNRISRQEYNLIVRNIRRIPQTSPVWAKMGRHERFERKFNT